MIINAILISLKVVFIATFFSFIIGIILSRIFTKYNFKFKSLIETIILCPMFLPPSVLGYLLLIIIGKNGFVGKFLYETLKIQLVFTWQGAAIAAGKDNIYVFEKEEGMLHENDAAKRLKDLVAGEGLDFSDLSEGKITFIAKYDGLLKINKKELFKLNYLGEISFATIHNNTPVKKEEKIAGIRVIPLIINENKILEAEENIKEKIVKVVPIKSKKVGIVTTGNEVYYGRIKDAFGPVIKDKVGEYNCEVIGQKILPDDKEKICKAIKEFINGGAELVVCTGGMSVDPDDVTPGAIKNTGADIVSYGSPVLPGSMFLVSYYKDIPILGLPGCVMYNKRTVFDLVLPRVLAEEKLEYKDIIEYGYGGFCMNCDDCTFPKCAFGKGV